MKEMKKYSFIGKNSKEAMKKAIETIGEDAIFISQKVVEDENGSAYEIIVGKEIEEEIDINISDKINNHDIISNIDNLNNNKNNLKSKDIDSIKKISRNNTFENKHFDEFESLKKEIKNINEFLLRNYQNKKIPLPPEFLEIENLLQKANIEKNLHKLILNKMIEKTPNFLKNDKILVRLLKDILNKMIFIEHQNFSKVSILCGPTGVGKTTTIAKIAANIKLLDKNKKVGVISLDNYKVGAFKQLEAYSEVLDLPLEIIEKPNQLIKAFHSLKEMDHIFIDTAGSSPYDLSKINKLEEFLDYHSKVNIEKILVIPANTKYDDAKDIFVNFNIIDIDSIIVTKLDETNNYGDIFSFLHFSQKPIRNFGIGQMVPNDFIKANNSFLIDLVLKFKKLSHKKKV